MSRQDLGTGVAQVLLHHPFDEEPMVAALKKVSDPCFHVLVEFVQITEEPEVIYTRYRRDVLTCFLLACGGEARLLRHSSHDRIETREGVKRRSAALREVTMT